MEQHALKEILNALTLHSEQINKNMDERFAEVDMRFEQVDRHFEQIDRRFDQMDNRFDSLEKKVDGIKVELYETQETVDYLSIKNVQQEKKIRALVKEKQEL